MTPFGNTRRGRMTSSMSRADFIMLITCKQSHLATQWARECTVQSPVLIKWDYLETKSKTTFGNITLYYLETMSATPFGNTQRRRMTSSMSLAASFTFMLQLVWQLSLQINWTNEVSGWVSKSVSELEHFLALLHEKCLSGHFQLTINYIFWSSIFPHKFYVGNYTIIKKYVQGKIIKKGWAKKTNMKKEGRG